jgi:oligopeptidase B
MLGADLLVFVGQLTKPSRDPHLPRGRRWVPSGCRRRESIAPKEPMTTPRSALPTPPVPKKEPKRIEQLGRVRVDDYAWMKDDNWQKVLRDPSTIKADAKAHLLEENAYTKAMLASTEALQKTIFEEMKGRVKEDDSSIPTPDGPWEYFSRFVLGAEQPRFLRRPRGDADPAHEELLLDADALAQGKAYFKVAAAEHSGDHLLFAYAADEQGSEVHRIYVRDLATGTLLPEPIESSTGDFTFSPCGQHLFWVFRDDHGRPAKIFRRPARGGAEDDVLIHDEENEGFFLSIDTTQSGAYIRISAGDHETSETRLIPATDPTAMPTVVEPRTTGLRYDVEHWDGVFCIRTNDGGAIDFQIVKAPVESPGRASWQPWIPHQPGRYIVGTTAREGFFLRLVRENANNTILVTDKAGAEHAIAFDEEAFALGLEHAYEFHTDELRFRYESPTTPKQWFDYDLVHRTRTLRKTQEIPSGHDPAKYVTKRLFATAPDGEQVPITVLARRDVPLDGSAPLLVYGYGSYGISMEPSFSIRNLSLVDRGFVWAVAHIRGGSEKGWGWFEAGRKEKKPNTFTDFIACTEHLIAQGYGSKGRVVAYGGSAGGMLMGAITNLRPDLFAGIIGAVPFVDVLNTMSDTTLPLTPPEWPEWGNPLEDEAAYDTIAAYSPYDNVAPRAYPAVLATGGLSDPRVTYWEPQKWVAKLRDNTTSDKPILLRINMEAGHGGASGRFDFLKEIALDYAFALWAIDEGWKQG